MIIKKRVPLSMALLAGIISFLVFLRAVAGDFVNYDDPRFVIDNLEIRHLDGQMIMSALTQQFSNDYWAPLTWISFAIDYHFWGLNPAGYHLVNILLHAVNTGLVVLVAHKIWSFNKNSAVQETGSLYSIMLLLAGLLWGIHPLRVESVAWVAERKDVLYGMLTFGTILCYLRYAETTSLSEGMKAKRYYFAALLLFSLALMAKPTSVFVPMLLVVADWYPLRRLHKGMVLKVLLEKAPFFVLSALVTKLTILKMSMTSAPYSYSDFPFTDRVIISGHSIIEFCRLMFYPAGIHLFNTIAPVLADPVPAYAKTAAVAAFACYGVFVLKRNPSVMAVGLSFLIPLLPTLPFFQVGVDVAYSTRHSYLPSVVPSIALVAIAAGGYKKISGAGYCYRWITCFLITAVLVFHVSMTEHLISTWKNSGTLWSRVIKFNPVGRAYYYRALFSMDSGHYQAAAEDFKIAAEKAELAGNPEAFNFYAFGGDASNRAGNYEEAVAAFTVAIKLHPLPNYYYHRGMALKSLGRLNEAAADFRIAGDERGNIEFQETR